MSADARAASFPRWHYDFDLAGYRTNPSKAEWQEWRASHLLGPIVEHYGGSLAGKRVLDLGCNAGYFSLKAIEAGCDYVLGVDGRQMHVDQANLVFDTLGVERWVVDFNPLFAALDVIRSPLLGVSPSPYSWPVLLITTLIGSAFSFLFFARWRARISYWAN